MARLVNLLATEGAAIEEVAAITFTEAAAAELRDRLGEELERRAADDPDCPAARAAAGLESRGRRPPCTASPGGSWRSTPSRRAYPRSSRCSTASSRWSTSTSAGPSWSTACWPTPTTPCALQVAAACRVGTNVLREIAQKFEDNWDLLPAPAPPIPPPQVDVSAVLRPLQEAFALADRCTDPGDRLLDHLAALGPWAERLAKLHR